MQLHFRQKDQGLRGPLNFRSPAPCFAYCIYIFITTTFAVAVAAPVFTLRLANGEIADTPSNAHHSAGTGEMVGSTTSPAAQCGQMDRYSSSSSSSNSSFVERTTQASNALRVPLRREQVSP